jgi:hypothetical protein
VVIVWLRKEPTIEKRISATAAALTPKPGAIHTVLVNAFFHGFFCPEMALSPFGERMFNLGRFTRSSFKHFPN